MRFKLFFLSVWLGFSFYTSAKEKPNIILIMVDDMGWGDLGSYGQQMIRTPNIDALAAQGMRFTNYYAGNTVCAPSREALLTGMHTGHTFIRGNFLTDEQEDPPLPDNRVTIAEKLKHAGYYTGLVGKWGLGGEKNGPKKKGFDYSYGYLDQIQAHNYYPPFLYENGTKIILDQNSSGKQGAYSHHLFVDKTFGFLDKRPKEKPFFLYLPYTIPHGKHVIPDASAYADQDWPEQFKNYAAMISLLDSDIGRLLSKLKDKKLDENTLIFFTSDNGANAGFSKFFKSNGPFRGAKTNLYEGGIRAPLIAYWPKHVKSGEVNNHVIAGWDFMPTLLEFAGATGDAKIDGLSFYPTLMGVGQQPAHKYLYWEYYTYNYDWNKPGAKLPRNWLDSRAARMGNWKAIVKTTAADQKGTMQLFNLKTDQTESKDLSAEHPKIVKQMWRILAEASTPNAPYFPYKN